VGRDDLAVMDQRTAARAEYSALVRHGGDWLPPVLVRQPLGAWKFAVATDRIHDAEAVLVKRDEVAVRASALAVAVPTALRTAYQTADPTFDDANVLADRELLDLGALADASAAVDAPRGVFASVGLIGARPEADLAAARETFAQGGPNVAATATAISSMIGAAAGVGRGRVTVAVSAFAILLLLLVVAAVLLRRQRARRAAAQPDPADAYATLAAPTTDVGSTDPRDAISPDPPAASAPAGPADAPPATGDAP
jgi:hypothetical protein